LTGAAPAWHATSRRVGATLEETPFTKEGCASDEYGAHCNYQFVFPTTSARNAQQYVVSDLRWDSFKDKGRIAFFPMFSALSSAAVLDLSENETEKPPAGLPAPQKPISGTKASPAKTSFTSFSLSEFDFDKVKIGSDGCSLEQAYVELYIGLHKLVQTDDFDLFFQSKTSAVLNLRGVDASGKLALPKPVTDKILKSKGVDPTGKLTSDTYGSAATIKSIHFVLKGSSELDESSVVLNIPLPKVDSTPLVVTLSYVHVSDSRKVNFVGDQVLKIVPTSVTFEGASLVAVLDPTEK
jgi:hypothetical protein